MKVALATSPSPHFDRALEHDLALAKAALLYADEVEMVGLGVSLLEKLRSVVYGDIGMLGFLRSLDDSALAYVNPEHAGKFPAGWRENVDRFQRADLQRLKRSQPALAQHFEQFRDQVDKLTAGALPLVDQILESAGSTELSKAVEAKVVRIADLNVDLSSLFRPRETRGAENEAQIRGWVDALIDRMEDRTVRLLFDRGSAGVLQELVDNGELATDRQTLRLANQAALGAGLVSRLPAFPEVPMDELLDLRKELTAPLRTYRGAIVRYSKQMPLVLGDDVDFEIQQLWEGDVLPAIEAVKDELADHGLVRELARSVSARDIRNFAWTAGTTVALGTAADLGALTTTAIAAASAGLPVLAEAAIDAARSKAAANGNVKRREFYYLYEANRRLAR